MDIITLKEQIRNFFFEKHFHFLASILQWWLQKVILSSCMKEDSGKAADYAETGLLYRTIYGAFSD